MTKKQKTRKKRGGRLLYEGSFGCIYKPSLRCATAETFPPDKVSKLSLRTKLKKNIDSKTSLQE